MKTKRLVTLGLLTAIALTIFMLEAQIPPIVPMPGVKLGLANIVSLVALYLLGGKSAYVILAIRCILGSAFGGGIGRLRETCGAVSGAVLVIGCLYGYSDLPGGDQKALFASLLRLANLEGEYTVRPGHSGSTVLSREKEYNPFIKQARAAQ